MRRYATVWERFCAMLIDSVVISVLSFWLMFINYFYLIGAYPLLFIFYFALCEGTYKHATLGKMVMGLTVVDANGMGIDIGKAFGRAFCRILSSLVLGIGYWIALGSDTRQTLHDRIVGSYVVKITPQYQQMPSPGPVPTPAPAPGPVVYNLNPVLICISGELAGRSFPFRNGRAVIGRDPAACDIVMSSNCPGISRQHCIVSFDYSARYFLLSDYGSSYGTFTASGVRIYSGTSQALQNGERFYLGTRDTMFEVRYM